MKKIKRSGKTCRKYKKILKRKILRNKLSMRRFLLNGISSPHNTTQYLMKNNSTPFFCDDDIELVTSSMIILDDEDCIFNLGKKESLVSTTDESLGYIVKKKFEEDFHIPNE